MGYVTQVTRPSSNRRNLLKAGAALAGDLVERGGQTAARRIAQAAQVDRMIKGLRAKTFAGDPWDALLQLALTIAKGDKR